MKYQISLLMNFFFHCQYFLVYKVDTYSIAKCKSVCDVSLSHKSCYALHHHLNVWKVNARRIHSNLITVQKVSHKI